jgi:hypothetical protein
MTITPSSWCAPENDLEYEFVLWDKFRGHYHDKQHNELYQNGITAYNKIEATGNNTFLFLVHVVSLHLL